MGGAELGVIGTSEAQDIGNLLIMNRELALESATERAERVILGFRRKGVFERTFNHQLHAYNALLGFAEVAEGGFVPRGYHDPYAHLPNLPGRE